MYVNTEHTLFYYTYTHFHYEIKNNLTTPWAIHLMTQFINQYGVNNYLKFVNINGIHLEIIYYLQDKTKYN